jgi:hypothetical protein
MVDGALMETFSTDGGATWSTPTTVSNTGTFIQDVQITGDMSGNGTVYIAGMDEGGGGFPHNDENLIFKSTTAASPSLTPTPAHLSRDRVLLLLATSPKYLTPMVATGGMRAGANLRPSTTSFTWSMTSTAPAVILLTSITFAPPTAV